MLEPSTEIDRYLQKNYIKVNTDELMTQLKNSEIKSYALKFKVTELEKAFRFICPRWSIFQKIWIVLDKNEREISLLFKNKLFGKKEFFCKNFRNKFYEFYILKNGRKIPKTEIEFFGAFQESKIYSLLRKTKTKQDFIKNVDRFETWSKK